MEPTTFFTMTTTLTIELLPIVASQLESFSRDLKRSKDMIINQSLIETMGMKGIPLPEVKVWGMEKKKDKQD